MHTKSLATLKHQLLRNKLVSTARQCISKNANLSQLNLSMQEAYNEMQTPLVYQRPTGCIDAPVDGTILDVDKEIDGLLPVEVKEQRLSNLLQALMVDGCVAAMPFLKKIPTAWCCQLYMISPLGKACARMVLIAVHDILLKTGYKEDEEGADNELSFQEWTQQVRDTLNTKKFGDIAFRDKDFKNAIYYYSKLVAMMSVPSGTVFVRRVLSYLIIGQPELALRDAMQAQVWLP
ncbi:hypothetical protein Goarm_000005 [Gossypium armourianum]|uniref:Serine/threonine-protein kinase BSK1-like TPR repeats domain-containing protein n=1 Tax=Gossypium armourianum TaxID=34283 RepID=A0A7J9KI26_9ROSI|nr:hypothetical protein [Gossypium armourianum]